ncbi:MAG: hypothetical protein JRN20_18290, partial [Nitrososphaerota archaeon]|nr:hypothetical protein [Nitrososphaerota archaeon]
MKQKASSKPFWAILALALLLFSSLIGFSSTVAGETANVSHSQSLPQSPLSTASSTSASAFPSDISKIAGSIGSKFQSLVGSLKTKLNLGQDSLLSPLQPSVTTDPPGAVNYAQTP